jgi:hypothetical protein
VYVEKLELRDVRCFANTCFSPRYPGREDEAAAPADVDYDNITLLLGNNGSGKTTALRGLAVGVLSRVLEVSGYRPYRVVRNRSKTGEAVTTATVRLGKLDRPPNNIPRDKPLVLTTRIRREGDYERLGEQEGPYLPDLFVDLSPTFFMVGYGATRRVESSDFTPSRGRQSEGLRFLRVSGLFKDFVGLTPLTAWLPHLKLRDPKRFAEVKQVMNRLLPPEIRFTGQQERPPRGRGGGGGGGGGSANQMAVSATGSELALEYVFELDGDKLPFAALSDGYRAYIAWVADLLMHLCQCTPARRRMTDLEGLVLVDEIDLHLHPAWQREVMRTISAGLPRLQFVCTTHSPIVAGTLRREQVFVMERCPDGTSRVARLTETLHGLNADQILTSPYFGLSTTRAPGFVSEMKRLRNRAWKGDRNATITLLKRMAGEVSEEPGAVRSASDGGPRISAAAATTPASAPAKAKAKPNGKATTTKKVKAIAVKKSKARKKLK